MKVYYADLSVLQLISFPFFFIIAFILNFLLVRIITKEKTDVLSIITFVFIIFHSFLLFVDFKFDIFPFFPDTVFYDGILKSSYSEVDIGTLPLGYLLLAKPLFLISLKSFLNYSLINFTIFNFSSIIFIKSFQNIYGKLEFRSIVLSLILTFLLPTVLLYSLTPLREPYVVFGFALFIYSLSKENKLNVFTLLSIVITILFRPQILVLYILILLLMKLFKISGIYRRLAILFIVVAPVFLVMNYVTTAYLNIELSPQSLASFRNYQRIQYLNSGVVYPLVEWTNWFDVLFDIPGLFFQFLLAPLPIIVFIDFWNKYFNFVDGLFVSGLILIVLMNVKDVFFKYSLWITIFVLFVFLNSMFEYHLYSAIRHRLSIIMFLIPLVSQLLCRRKNII